MMAGSLLYLQNVGGDIRLIIHDLKEQDGNVIEFKRGVVSSPSFSQDDIIGISSVQRTEEPSGSMAIQDSRREFCPAHKQSSSWS